MGRRTVLFLTGEPSGDAAAARVAEALLRREPDLRVRAVGGRRLAAAGAGIVQDIAALSAMGFAEVLLQIPRLAALERRLTRLLDEERPDVVVPVDYPGFNLRIARAARERGIPVAYYIGPQIWAWGAGRLPRIARAVDVMLVVFDFEVPWYQRAGIAVRDVGHPLADTIHALPERHAARTALDLPADAPVLGLLAGSRAQEVRRILPAMAEAAHRLARTHPGLRIVASAAPDVPRAEYDAALGPSGSRDVALVERPLPEIAAAADVLLVTSGTATLEAGLSGTPLAVLYRTSPLTWFLGKRLVKIPRIALANIVAGEDVAPEFLQDGIDPAVIAEWASGVLDDPARRADIRRRLLGLRARLGPPGSADRAAAEILARMPAGTPA